MEAQPEQPAEELKRLQRCINDLVGVTTLPAVWGGGEPAEIVPALLDVLLGTLSLDLIYVRSEVAANETPAEMARVAQSLSLPAGPREIGEVFDRWLGSDARDWPPLARNTIGDGAMTVVTLPLGLQGEVGVLVAGSRRADFPQQTERLVLSAAANQAAVGLRQARLLSEQRRVAGELDERVARRTSELAAANEALRKEFAERRRAEAALRESERDSRLIVDSIPGLIAVFTPGGEVESVNRQVLEYFGGTNTDIDDRKRAEAQRDRTIEELRTQQSMLSESEQRFRAIFDEAGTGITLVDLRQPDAPIQNNRALQTMLGLSQEKLGFFETYDELTAGDAREADAAAFRELCEGRRDSLRQEKHFVLRDGSSVWANVIFTLLRDSAGLPRFIIAIHEDITERKRAVERLQAKQELLDLAQKSARAMAFDWYVQQEVNVWSPEQEALYGLPPGSFDGTYQGWKKLVYAPDWPLLLKAINHAHETGEVAVEFRVVWPDGSLHWLATNGQMFFDEPGEPFRMVGFTSDITPRKLAEEDLRRSEAFLAEAQRLSSTGSFSWRVETGEITWSEQAYHIFELDPAAHMTPELIRTRVHPEDAPLFDGMLSRARATGGDFEFEHRLLMPDHRVKYLHVIAHGGRGRDGEPEYIGAVQDVTERRLSEEALGKLRAELAHVSRVTSLGALTASIAHEVNQPLSGIITNASTCQRMLNAEPPNLDGARETVRRTIRDGNRASDVIKRLRALFGRKEAATESVDLNEATREVIALSLSELQRGRVILRTELADGLRPVTGDRVQLQQVILNLLLNASDAMRGVEDRPRELVIRTGQDEGDCVRLSVQDAGVGFDPQDVGRLFEAFYTTKSGGMGIGLSVSRSIIESHQGRLWATPNDGPGATFSFSIPHSSEATTDASGVGAIPKPASTDAGRADGGS
jgi:PAS domain S-box-containing protein